MLTLYSYPELFGVADNNAYGLKVFAFLRLAGVPLQKIPSSACGQLNQSEHASLRIN
jgi:hypothetical protein